MTRNDITTLQEIYFDLCDLLENNDLENIQIEGFSEFENLREFIEEQREKLAPFTDDGEE